MRHLLLILTLALAACTKRENVEPVRPRQISTISYTEIIGPRPAASNTTTATQNADSAVGLKTKSTATGPEIVTFAKTLLGTRYQYGCSAPSQGFDCSGFVGYVFKRFNIPVPRSSVDFTNAGTAVPLSDARPGDVILFTGTNAERKVVGHVGIIVSNPAEPTQFIHASSGTENAVIITPLNERYQRRFVKVVRMVQ